jgi:Right handed beta helix region
MGKDTKKKLKLGKILGVSSSLIMGLLVVGTLVSYNSSGVLQGKIKVWLWKGNDTLRCSGNQVLKIKGKSAHTGSFVIYASGSCKVYLDKVDFQGNSGIYLNGNAVLTAKNSKIHGGKSHGIYLGAGTRANLENTEVVGKSAAIYVGSGAQVTVTGGSLESERQGVYVGSDASLKLENVRVKGKTDGIYVGSNSEVIASAGVIEGKTRAMYLGSKAKVTLQKTKTIGKFYMGRGATVTGRNFDKIRDTIKCKGSTVMTLKDKKVNLRKLVIEASGHCKLKLVNCELTGRPAAIQARDHAQIHLVGGKFKGRKHSILAQDYAIILVSKETKLVQKIGMGGDLVVVSRPTIDVKGVAAQLEGLAKQEKAYKKGACDGFLQCYKDNNSGGRFDVMVYMTPDDKGKITKVKIKRLVARRKRKVRSCIKEVAAEKVIEGYEGPAGKLWCRTWGSRQGFIVQVSSRSGFKYENPPKPKGVKPLVLPDAK